VERLTASIAATMEKLLSFFDVFDLSFLITGAGAVFAALFLFDGMGWPLPVDLSPPARFAGAALASYVIGMICMGLGRGARRRLVGPWMERVPVLSRVLQTTFPSEPMGKAIRRAMLSHGLDKTPQFKPYFEHSMDGEDGGSGSSQRFSHLYSRLWAQVRQERNLTESLKHLDGHWRRAAIYDGMIAVVFMWFACFSAVLSVGLERATEHTPAQIVLSAQDLIEIQAASQKIIDTAKQLGEVHQQAIQSLVPLKTVPALKTKKTAPVDPHLVETHLLNLSRQSLDIYGKASLMALEGLLISRKVAPGPLAEYFWMKLLIMALVCLAAIYVCMREASRCDRYQLEELVGTIAWQIQRRDAGPQSSSSKLSQ